MASLFIAGRDIDSALSSIKKICSNGVTFTADLLGEYSVSQEESDIYLNRYLDTIKRVNRKVN